MLVHRIHLNDDAATQTLGIALAAALVPALVIHLIGDLGAGKTTLVRGILRGLGHAGPVKSPSYTLLEPYTLVSENFSRLNFYHFDLYRFRDEQEWHDAGFRELFDEHAIGVIEWPEKAAHLVPSPDLTIDLAVSSSHGRDVVITAHTASGERCIEQLQHAKPQPAPTLPGSSSGVSRP